MREHVWKITRKVQLEWSLKDGVFSMTGGIWNARHTDFESCGQNIEEIAALFPTNPRVQRMAAIWRDWHLNDMRAGSPVQEAWLKANPQPNYEKACEALAAVGLNPDSTGYKYGHKWLREELPADVVVEIESWSQEPVGAKA